MVQPAPGHDLVRLRLPLLQIDVPLRHDEILGNVPCRAVGGHGVPERLQAVKRDSSTRYDGLSVLVGLDERRLEGRAGSIVTIECTLRPIHGTRLRRLLERPGFGVDIEHVTYAAARRLLLPANMDPLRGDDSGQVLRLRAAIDRG